MGAGSLRPTDARRHPPAPNLPRRRGARKSGPGGLGSTDRSRRRRTPPAPPPLPDPPPRRPSPYQCPGPFSRRRLALVGQGAEGTCRAGLAGQAGAGLGRRVAAPQPARDYLPAPAAHLVGSLVKLWRLVFRLLGNRGGARASARPACLRPAQRGRGRSGQIPPRTSGPASLGAGLPSAPRRLWS